MRNQQEVKYAAGQEEYRALFEKARRNHENCVADRKNREKTPDLVITPGHGIVFLTDDVKGGLSWREKVALHGGVNAVYGSIQNPKEFSYRPILGSGINETPEEMDGPLTMEEWMAYHNCDYRPPRHRRTGRRSKKRANKKSVKSENKKVEVEVEVAPPVNHEEHERDAHKEHELEKVNSMLSEPSRGRINIYIRSARQDEEAKMRVLWVLGYTSSWIHEDILELATVVAQSVRGNEDEERKPWSMFGPAMTSKLKGILKKSAEKVVVKEFIRRRNQLIAQMQ